MIAKFKSMFSKKTVVSFFGEYSDFDISDETTHLFESVDGLDDIILDIVEHELDIFYKSKNGNVSSETLERRALTLLTDCGKLCDDISRASKTVNLRI